MLCSEFEAQTEGCGLLFELMTAAGVLALVGLIGWRERRYFLRLS